MNMEFDESEIDNSFRLCSGKTLKNLKDLKRYVKEMPDEVYNYHVTGDKNDFAFWLKNCLELGQLAKSLNGVKTKRNFIKKILEA